MISADLNGKCVLVTGGLSGIGLATVKAFATAGAQVAVNHLPDDPTADPVLEELRKEGHKIVSAPGDVSDPDQSESMVDKAIAALGRLDVLAAVEVVPVPGNRARSRSAAAHVGSGARGGGRGRSPCLRCPQARSRRRSQRCLPQARSRPIPMETCLSQSRPNGNMP